MKIWKTYVSLGGGLNIYKFFKSLNIRNKILNSGKKLTINFSRNSVFHKSFSFYIYKTENKNVING
jgi:hypothetical protein